jgi:hypothetical protein
LRASDILRHLCVAVAGQVHAARRRLMLAAVDSLLRGNRLTLTELGRQLDSTAAYKHRIKTIDRFVSNHRTHDDVARWYAAAARRLLRGFSRPVVLIDWTQTIGPFHALVAAVAFSGRAIPVYAEVHPEERLGNRVVQERFLAALAAVLPAKMRPIIVADAGFRTPFFGAVRDQNWDFVIRLRGNGVLTRWAPHGHRNLRLRFRTAFARATDKPQDLGEWKPYSSNFTGAPAYRTILATKPPSANGRRRHDAYARRGVEPWLLATSLRHAAARTIVELYALRMQIELTFRDAKNGNVGWGLEHSRSRSAERQAVLLLIVCLALTVTLLVGARAERDGEARRYQANTVRTRRVQSLHRLGLYVLASQTARLALALILQERRLIRRFLRTGVQLCLPLTTLHYGRFRVQPKSSLTLQPKDLADTFWRLDLGMMSPRVIWLPSSRPRRMGPNFTLYVWRR